LRPNAASAVIDESQVDDPSPREDSWRISCWPSLMLAGLWFWDAAAAAGGFAQALEVAVAAAAIGVAAWCILLGLGALGTVLYRRWRQARRAPAAASRPRVSDGGYTTRSPRCRSSGSKSRSS
jgi:hypothetical protein